MEERRAAFDGIVERIAFRNDENGYTVLRMRPEDEGDGVRALREPAVTAVGHFPAVSVGERLRLWGEWVHHAQYGRQLSVTDFTVVAPGTLEGIRRYLGSGLIHGIGPAFAERLVAHFGEDTLHVIEHEPQRLREVEGIGPRRAEAIRSGLQQQKAIQAIMVFLQGYGISPAFALRIYRVYGEGAAQTVRDNPYRLAADVPGIGFKTADNIARSLGVGPDAPERLAAGLLYTLEDAAGKGHVLVHRAALLELAAQTLGSPPSGPAPSPASESGIGPEQLVEPLDKLVAAGRIIDEDGLLYTPRLHRAEVGLAAGLRRLLDGFLPLRVVSLDAGDGSDDGFGSGDGIGAGVGGGTGAGSVTGMAGAGSAPQAASGAVSGPGATLPSPGDFGGTSGPEGVALSPEQRAAVEEALNRGVFVITGGPGTGKTTILKALVARLEASGRRIELACPTGRAAQRLKEVTGRDARTIHRLLEFGPVEGEGFRFQRNENNPLKADAVIIDEASMVDLPLAWHLIRAVPTGAQLIFVGDVDQLPPVGPGYPLRDIIDSGVVPTARLTRIFRQAEQSLIVTNAHRMLRGEPLVLNRAEGDFFFIECDDNDEVASQVRDLALSRVPGHIGGDAVEDVQVLSPIRRSVTGVDHLNDVLQASLNPPSAGKAEWRAGPLRLRVGDKVMQTRNNYDKGVFNGDVGRVQSVDEEEGLVFVRYVQPDGVQVVEYGSGDADELTLAYCITVHKSQGSEYPAVIMPLTTQHYIMLQRHLLYTAVTRARRLVVLVGSRKALQMALDGINEEPRATLLKQRLQGRAGQDSAGQRPAGWDPAE